MGNLYDTLTACLTDQLIQAVLSAARKKDGPSRVKIRPVLHKGSLLFQTAAQVEKQQFHESRPLVYSGSYADITGSQIKRRLQSS